MVKASDVKSSQGEDKKEKKKKKERKRGQGEGTITKRPDGTYMAQISLGRDLNTGNRKRITVYGKDHEETKNKLIKLLADHQAGTLIVPRKITFSQWLDKYLENYIKDNVKLSTYENYKRNIDLHIKPALGAILLTKLTTENLQLFYNEKRKNGRKDGAGGLSIRTITFFHAVIHGALEQAYREGLVPKNVSEATRLPKGTKKKVVAIPPKEVTKLLTALQGNRLYALYVLEIGTGMRRGEIIALDWDNVDLKTGIVRITRTLMRTSRGELYFTEPKTDSSKRTLAISKSVVKALESHLVRQKAEKMELGDRYVDHNLVFCKPNGEPIFPNTFTMMHSYTLKRLKFKHVSFHALRHSVASALIGKVDPKVVQGTLGHDDIKTTMNIYADMFEDVQRDAANKLDELIPQGKPKRTKRASF